MLSTVSVVVEHTRQHNLAGSVSRHASDRLCSTRFHHANNALGLFPMEESACCLYVFGGAYHFWEQSRRTDKQT
jgi:hypothetical protein